MLIIGLTGSIGMGKSTAARMFLSRGVPVYDADAAVHALYDKGAAVAPLQAAFPGVADGGVIDRARLGAAVLGDAAALKKLEAIVHPLVRAGERDFLETARARNARMAVLEIPLLYETGADARCDVTVVASAPADIQRARVLARPGMSQEKLDMILSRQMSDEEKRARAHFIVETRHGFEVAQKQVDDIIRALSGPACGAIG